MRECRVHSQRQVRHCPAAMPLPPERSLSPMGLITHVSVIGFATALSTRAVDPIIPPISQSLGVDAERVALLTTAFTLPFVIAQPLVGPAADAIGKLRMMLICLIVIVAMSFACALAPSFAMLIVARIVCGAATGGIFPVGMAIIADAVPLSQRQVGIARWLTIVIAGNLLGTAFAGALADLFGWRAVFIGVGLAAIAALVNAVANLRHAPQAPPVRLDIKAIPSRYLAILANPRAKFCYLAVFAEGLAIFGLFSFVALLLLGAGEPRASIAGLVIAGFSIGGMVYSLAVTPITRRWQPRELMLGGGGLCALAFVGVAFGPVWQVQLVLFVLMGVGFYTLHSCIQVEASELSTTERGTAMSLHSLSFFLGHAAGPVLYSVGFAWLGAGVSVLLGGTVVMLAAVMCAHYLRRPVA
jgi:predicted MFS family arabinose efflux permease